MSEFKLNICHIYPDLLNLYGDTGNILCMQKRLEWRGIQCEVTGATVGQAIDPKEQDLFFIGGGQDFEQKALLEDCARGKRDAIQEAIEDDKVFLAICGGYQILGKYYQDMSGEKMEFLDCLDVYTVAKENRMIGNILCTCNELEGKVDNPTLVGFENHGGRTYLGKGVAPLATVVAGYGNNGEDETEGAVYRNVHCSYIHGPLLPKNPHFCDMLLEKALVRKYGEAALEKLHDDYEWEAHKAMEERLRKIGDK